VVIDVKVLRAKPELCTACHVCEEVCSTGLFKINDPEKSAVRISKAAEADKIDINTCDQCGQCIDICPTQAIYRAKNGIVMIRKSDCVGCYSCVGFCPQGAMRKHQDIEEPFKCLACGKCAKECPTRALFLAL